MSSLSRVWVNLPVTDVAVGCIFAAGWFVAPQVSVERVGNQAVAFPLIGAAANVLAILAAVVTFACSALYQSPARGIREGRLTLGRQLRKTWGGCIVAAALCSVTSLSAFVVWSWSARTALAILTACVLIATARTLRAVYWLNVVLAAEDRDLPGVNYATIDREKTAA